MGFSVSASTIIIFIGLVVSAGMLYGAWDYSQDTLTEGEEIKNQLHIDKQQTDIEILGETVEHIDQYLVFDAYNDGNAEHSLEHVSVVIDGEIKDGMVNEVFVKGHDDSGVWLPGDTIHMNVTVEETPDRIVLIVDNGVKDILEEW